MNFKAFGNYAEEYAAKAVEGDSRWSKRSSGCLRQVLLSSLGNVAPRCKNVVDVGSEWVENTPKSCT